MARPLRFQYPGAVYHVMARGDGGKRIFESDEEHAVFIARLSWRKCYDAGTDPIFFFFLVESRIRWSLVRIRGWLA
jgi:hypothetical protein